MKGPEIGHDSILALTMQANRSQFDQETRTRLAKRHIALFQDAAGVAKKFASPVRSGLRATPPIDYTDRDGITSNLQLVERSSKGNLQVALVYDVEVTIDAGDGRADTFTLYSLDGLFAHNMAGDICGHAETNELARLLQGMAKDLKSLAAPPGES